MTQVHGRLHIDARILAGARLIASKIDAEPGLVAIAHENIDRYCPRQRHLPRALTRWPDIIERPWAQSASHPLPAR